MVSSIASPVDGAHARVDDRGQRRAVVVGEQHVVARRGVERVAHGLGAQPRRVDRRPRAASPCRAPRRPRRGPGGAATPRARAVTASLAVAGSRSCGRRPRITRPGSALPGGSGSRQAPKTRLAALDRRLDQVHGRRADERGHEQVRRPREERLRRVALLQHAAAQHGDAVAQRHRLDLVVRHVDRGHAEPLVQPAELRAHGDAQLRVEVGERLVHQEGLRLAHDRAPHRHALALAARQLARLAVEHLGEAEDARHVLDAPADLVLAGLAQLQAEAEVAADADRCGYSA